MTRRPKNIYPAYHAHAYFDEQTLDQAQQLCLSVAQQFGITMGRVHQKLVGPHPRWSCQLAFDSKQFDRLILWLDQNRKGLTIFVHGLTGDDLEDHTDHASWLGESATLNLEFFRKKAE